jgi:DNA alkylation repair enzyme
MTTTAVTSDAFVSQLIALAGAEDDDAMNAVPMRDVFSLAKASIDMPLDEIESLLESPIHKARVGAVSILDFQARRKRTPPERRRELYDLYLRRHDRIDSWDLVDRAAPHVVGGYLADKPRDVLYDLARSGTIWERRTAIVATWFFIRLGETEDTFAIAELLVDDDREMIQTAVGGWIREAGKRDPERLTAFLDRHAATMPRTGLRYAIKLLDEQQRAHYLSLAEAN